MVKISLLILAKNEEKNIEACLKSAFEAVDEIIVIDDFSTDNTKALAENFGARVFQRKLDSFSAQYNYAQEKATGDFIFVLDADERFSPNLAHEIKEHVLKTPEMVGLVKRKNVAFGQKHFFGPLKADWVPRLFPKGSVKWTGLVHSSLQFSLTSKKLSNHLIHYTYRSWDHYLNKMQHYADLWAQDKHSQGRTSSYLEILLRLGFNLFKMLILNGGLLGGPLCWFLCYFNGAYTLRKYLKLMELNRKQ